MKKRFISALLTGVTAGVLTLPSYDSSHLIYVSKKSPRTITLSYDTDGNDVEDIREVRMHDMMTGQVSIPIYILWDRDGNGRFETNKGEMFQGFKPEKKKPEERPAGEI